MYDRLYNYWKRERIEPSLQSIDRDFYEELARYISQLRDHLRRTEKKSADVRLAEAELQRAEKLSRELIEMRVRKILRIGESDTNAGAASSAVIGDEKSILESALQTSETYQSIVQKVLAGEVSENTKTAPTKPMKVLIRFLTEIPAIVGVDLEPYGPFKAEDIAALPLQNAEIFMRGKAALRIACE